jgi:hypothetical protein
MKTNKSNTAERFTHTASDRQLLDDLDVVVADAAAGKKRAVGAIAIAFGPMLLLEAAEALGKTHVQDTADVVQELMLALPEARLTFPKIRGGAIPWLKRMVRQIAPAREPEGGLAG